MVTIPAWVILVVAVAVAVFVVKQRRISEVRQQMTPAGVAFQNDGSVHSKTIVICSGHGEKRLTELTLTSDALHRLIGISPLRTKFHVYGYNTDGNLISIEFDPANRRINCPIFDGFDEDILYTTRQTAKEFNKIMCTWSKSASELRAFLPGITLTLESLTTWGIEITVEGQTIFLRLLDHQVTTETVCADNAGEVLTKPLPASIH